MIEKNSAKNNMRDDYKTSILDLKNSVRLLDHKFDQHEKRLDDVKSFINTFAGVISILFAVIVGAATILGYFQFDREFERLKKLEESIGERLGLLEDKSNIVILRYDGSNPTEGKKDARIMLNPDPEFGPEFAFGVRLKNTGSTVADITQVKYYTKDPLSISNPAASDKEGYDYEEVQLYTRVGSYGSIVPPDSSVKIFLFNEIVLYEKTPAEICEIEGEHEVFFEVYYGANKKAWSTLKYNIENRLPPSYCEADRS